MLVRVLSLGVEGQVEGKGKGKGKGHRREEGDVR